MNWDAWKFEDDNLGALDAWAILPEEGGEVFGQILLSAGNFDQMIVSTGELKSRFDQLRTRRRPRKAALHERPNLSSVYQEPRTDTERTLAAVWGEFFGMKRVGIHDDFFELGGDSLLATQVVAKLNHEFQVDLPVSKLLGTPNIGAIAGHIDNLLAIMKSMGDKQSEDTWEKVTF